MIKSLLQKLLFFSQSEQTWAAAYKRWKDTVFLAVVSRSEEHDSV